MHGPSLIGALRHFLLRKQGVNLLFRPQFHLPEVDEYESHAHIHWRCAVKEIDAFNGSPYSAITRCAPALGHVLMGPMI